MTDGEDGDRKCGRMEKGAIKVQGKSVSDVHCVVGLFHKVTVKSVKVCRRRQTILEG